VDCVPLQALVLSRAGKVQVRYLVHWSGYSAEQATWEPRCNLDPDTITVDVEPSLRSIDRPPHEKLKKYGIYTVMSHTSTGRSITRYMLGRSVPLPRHTAVQVALWPIGQIYSCSTAVDTAVSLTAHSPYVQPYTAVKEFSPRGDATRLTLPRRRCPSTAGPEHGRSDTTFRVQQAAAKSDGVNSGCALGGRPGPQG
jgi:hypothetical protein